MFIPFKKKLITKSTFFLGAYPLETGKKPEPIEWIVLKKEGTKGIAVSKYGLDARPYNAEENKETIWETSDIRAWLNNDFYKEAFSAEEKTKLQLYDVVNSYYLRIGNDSVSIGKTGDSDTRDRVFLLSIVEAAEYIKESEKRQMIASCFAEDKGAPKNKETGFSIWWLRSPLKGGNSAAAVMDTGKINTLPYSDIHQNDKLAVRPAICIDLHSGLI